MNEILVYDKKDIYIGGQKHFIECFLEIKGGKSKYTSIGYARDIKDFFGTENLSDISLEHVRRVNIFHVQKFIMDLQAMELSSATINRKISSLSALYKWLMKYEDNYSDKRIIKFNPFANVKEEKPSITNKVTEFLTEDECRELLSSIDTSTILGLRNKAIMALALTTALRKSEMINIKIGNIKKYGEYDIIEVTRKGNKGDMVKLQPKVKMLIEEYIESTNRSGKGHDDEYLFIGHSTNNRNGEKLNPSTLNYMIKKVCKQCNFDKVLKVHSTRHTAITIAITQGATIEKVREFAAHRSIATTNRYIHSIDKLKENPGDNIDII
ncbi:MAG: tyrosine-type recombinase/integrase [Clostridium sp.]|uniref:tyrosine-type recombinase/integrase n=1 Tax=Clostridium sp. TaxID=1506 RepID=UPI00305E2265